MSFGQTSKSDDTWTAYIYTGGQEGHGLIVQSPVCLCICLSKYDHLDGWMDGMESHKTLFCGWMDGSIAKMTETVVLHGPQIECRTLRSAA